MNTTINLAASVITNDLLAMFRLNVPHKQTLAMAKGSTMVFGLATIIVALLVPAMGGVMWYYVSVP